MKTKNHTIYRNMGQVVFVCVGAIFFEFWFANIFAILQKYFDYLNYNITLVSIIHYEFRVSNQL